MRVYLKCGLQFSLHASNEMLDHCDCSAVHYIDKINTKKYVCACCRRYHLFAIILVSLVVSCATAFSALQLSMSKKIAQRIPTCAMCDFFSITRINEIAHLQKLFFGVGETCGGNASKIPTININYCHRKQ